MKKFSDICKMTQEEVKAYMEKYLSSKNYEVINEEGFLYAKGTVPVLLVAHMDTVHKQQCKTIVNENGRISSPQGIGGDDRCGVFIIMNLVTELNCSVLLCEDEEIGIQGAKKFAMTDYINNLDVNYMIEFDRKGSEDAVFYSCDNKDFTKFVTDATDYKVAQGSYSDISVLMPAAKLAGVNLSCGYYNPHTTTEYVVYSDMMRTIDAAIALIGTECESHFNYVPKMYAPPSWKTRYGIDYDYKMPNSVVQSSFLNDDFGYYDNPIMELARKDMELEIEVIFETEDGEEDTATAKGNTKAECWAHLFLENPYLCSQNIMDYSWS